MPPVTGRRPRLPLRRVPFASPRAEERQPGGTSEPVSEGAAAPGSLPQRSGSLWGNPKGPAFGRLWEPPAGLASPGPTELVGLLGGEPQQAASAVTSVF